MIQHLFLQGPSGIGKSTALLRALQQSALPVGGFLTQRLFRQGRLYGYAMIPAEQATRVYDDATYENPSCFLKAEAGQLTFDSTRFLTDFLSFTSHGSILLLDEIGGAELMIPEIRQAIQLVLEKPIPILGVWKSRENLLHMIHHGKAPIELLSYHQEMERLLSSQKQTLLLDGIPNDAELLRFIRSNGLSKDLPGRSFCMERLSNCSEAIRKHCLLVAKTTEALCFAFSAKDPEMLLQAALLHDVERHSPHHDQKLAQEMVEAGYIGLASCIRQHMHLQEEFYHCDEALLWLADKCCLEDQLVHPKIRFEESILRYGPTDRIKKNLRALQSFALSDQWDPKKLFLQGGSYENNLFRLTEDACS